MVRIGVCLTVVTALGAACLAQDGRVGGTGPTVVVTPQPARTEIPQSVLALREKLTRPINLPKGIDPNTPLKDALEFLSAEYDVPVHIDRPAFRMENLPEPEIVPVGLPKQTNVPFSTVLRRLLAGMDPPATFLVQYDRLVIVPRGLTRPVSWTADVRAVVPTVDVEFERRPLDQALREVALRSGINVVLDAKVGDKAKTAVTTSLSDMAVDTAVILLADMAGLTVLALDNALYVTTRDHGDVLQAELEKRDLRDRLTTPSPRSGAQ